MPGQPTSWKRLLAWPYSKPLGISSSCTMVWFMDQAIFSLLVEAPHSRVGLGFDP